MSVPTDNTINDMPDSEQLFGQWKRNPTPRTLTPLIDSLNPIVEKAMSAYGYAGDPNIKSSAQLHVVDALNRYQPQKGAKLPTFMFNELKRIKRLGPRQQFAIPIPEKAGVDIHAIKRIEHDLSADLGRDPSVNELADATGLSVWRITSLRKQYEIPAVLENSYSQMEGGAPGQAIDEDDKDKLWFEATYGELDPVDQQIMDWSLGWHGKPRLSKTQMAAQLRISIPAITKRAQKIAQRLNQGVQYRIL